MTVQPLAEGLVPRPTGQSYDSLPVSDTTPDMLDLKAVEEHIQRAVELERYDGLTDPEEFLIANRCLASHQGRSYPTVAGILCFGKDPQSVFPRAVVDTGRYAGEEAISDELIDVRKDVGGTLFEQLRRVEDFIYTHTMHGMRLPERGLQRIPVHQYPQIVTRELLVNSLAHRDYSNFFSATRILIFRNRIEWVNPGGLPEGVTVQDLVHEQHPRNPVIIKLLHQSGYVEAFGQGIDTVYAVLKKEGLKEPQFKDTGASFVAIVFGRTQEEMDNLMLLDTDGSLSDTQHKIIKYLREKGGVVPSADLRQHFTQIPERTLTRELAELRDLGYVERVGATRNTRYRLLPKER